MQEMPNFTTILQIKLSVQERNFHILMILIL